MWKSIQYAVQGLGHIKESIPCQDKTHIYIDDNIAVAALADGAGSAKLSHLGAEHITHFICEDLAQNFDYYFENNNGIEVKNKFDIKIKEQLSKLSEELKCQMADLASTLLMVAVKDNHFILLHIGDGVIGYSKEDRIRVASTPTNGEFVNATVFTTSDDVVKNMQLMKGNTGNIDGFVLMSDGAETSLYNKKNNKLADVLERIIKMLTFLPTEIVQKQLINSFDTVIRNSTSDDCSISILANIDDSFLGYSHLNDIRKSKLLNIKRKSKSDIKRIRRYDKMLDIMLVPCSVKRTAKMIHLKPKYTKRHIHRLKRLNLVEKQGKRYKTILIMDNKSECHKCTSFSTPEEAVNSHVIMPKLIMKHFCFDEEEKYTHYLMLNSLTIDGNGTQDDMESIDRLGTIKGYYKIETEKILSKESEDRFGNLCVKIKNKAKNGSKDLKNYVFSKKEKVIIRDFLNYLFARHKKIAEHFNSHDQAIENTRIFKNNDNYLFNKFDFSLIHIIDSQIYGSFVCSESCIAPFSSNTKECFLFPIYPDIAFLIYDKTSILDENTIQKPIITNDSKIINNINKTIFAFAKKINDTFIISNSIEILKSLLSSTE
ncbi:PP2C family serine/threonine-protein phosphatase [Ruminococcus sp.]|uniref:PP2C family serine/threonine-protein phosphatase n=1 Tax=Ruminococcus sp. TaxID=41978 RepID=UPI0026003004|nr:PP2C family serine/threonine-protein phosphatase [Ruminococcus sp.]MBR1432096.1 protein phosphatase 2C domain-containing protein [Ruminococcus sp.]